MPIEFSVNKTVDKIMPFVMIGGINDRELFNKVILGQFNRGLPIQISGFIGQGGKNHLGGSDIELLDKYQRLKQEIGKDYPFGSEVSLIGADLHGIANGKTDAGYLSLMGDKVLEYRYNWRLLSELYQEKELKLPNLEHVESMLLEKKEDFERWNLLPNDVKNAFISMASKHWGDRALLGAFYYFLMRQNEFSIFKIDFKDFLFVINGSGDLSQYVFPNNIPQMFWIDTKDGGRKGRHMSLPPPWFRDD